MAATRVLWRICATTSPSPSTAATAVTQSATFGGSIPADITDSVAVAVAEEAVVALASVVQGLSYALHV